MDRVLNPDEWALWMAVLVFLGGSAVTVYGGVRLTALGDRLADVTGWGEALFGAVLLGAATSLSGIVTTATAAFDNQPGLAYSNAVGGLAAQTAALGLADFAYRKANLEHAAASLGNIFSGLLLIVLLSVACAVRFVPEWTLGGIHFGSALLVVVYLYGVRIGREIGAHPMWRAEETALTLADTPNEALVGAGGASHPLSALLVRFGLFAFMVSMAGWLIAEAGARMVELTPLSATQVGAVLLGVTNSLPEAVVAVSAVRRGALTLAIAGVVGGNAFDVLNLAIGDVFYRGGSLFHIASEDDLMLLLITLMMTAVVVAGQVRRERKGPASIGMESVLVLGLYALAMVAVAL